MNHLHHGVYIVFSCVYQDKNRQQKCLVPTSIGSTNCISLKYFGWSAGYDRLGIQHTDLLLRLVAVNLKRDWIQSQLSKDSLKCD